nr:MAG TPA: hypothetical protein [Caudoviricetes sp.]
MSSQRGNALMLLKFTARLSPGKRLPLGPSCSKCYRKSNRTDGPASS